MDPRFQLTINASNDTQFKLYYGTYSQQLFKANSMPTADSDDGELSLYYRSADTDMEFAEHLGVGVEHYVNPNLMFKGEIFKKNYFDLTITTETEQETTYYNGGKGFSEGIELLLQQLLADRFEGWFFQ